jgi:hypothetical protein
VIALKARDLYLKDAGEGKHHVTCPWEKGHTTEVASARPPTSPRTPAAMRVAGLSVCTHIARIGILQTSGYS